MRGLLVRVGIDSTDGNWNAPVRQASGEFAYVTIAQQRYDQCVAYGFGSRENLGRIVLVGHEQAVRDGRLFTPTLRKQFIAVASVQTNDHCGNLGDQSKFGSR